MPCIKASIKTTVGVGSDDAFRALKRLADSATWENESLDGALYRVRQWVGYADEALLRKDIYSASACLAVVRRLLGK